MEKGTGKDAGIRLNRENHTVMIGGEEIQLNAMEYKVLECLVKNSGVVLSRERILHLVWELRVEQACGRLYKKTSEMFRGIPGQAGNGP